MSRLVPYRAKAPTNIKQRIDETLVTTMYLVQTTGPTSYVVQEQNCDTKHKVLIGMLQTCSCGDGDVCIHILFVMLKVLRVPVATPIVWQKSLIDSEVEALLRGDYCTDARPQATKHNTNFLKRRQKEGGSEGNGAGKDEAATTTEAQRHELVEGEVCAICQEDMTAAQPLTYCRKGCGNNFHIECMKVFGESRKQSKEHIICPLCRQDWGDLALTELKKAMDVANNAPNVHKGVTCKRCQTKPIRHERYRCVQCKNVDLCGHCFKSNAHINHSFVSKKQVTDAWTPALRSTQRSPGISTELVEELQNRDLTTNDYDLLLELDRKEKFPIQEYLLTIVTGGQRVAAANAKSFGEPGAACSICRQSLRIQADVRSILCGHAFHESCLARLLLAQAYACPYAGCEHIMFPGLHHLVMKQKGVSSNGDEEKPKLPSAIEQAAVDSLLCVIPVQAQSGNQAPDTKRQIKHQIKPKSRGVPSRARQAGPETEELSSLSIGSTRTALILPALDPTPSSAGKSKRPFLHQRVNGERTRAEPGSQSDLPSLGATMVSSDDRLKHAEHLRMERRQLEKERHRKQTLERQERVRQNQSNNQNDHEALVGLLPHLGLPPMQSSMLGAARGKPAVTSLNPGRRGKEFAKSKPDSKIQPREEGSSLSVASIRRA